MAPTLGTVWFPSEAREGVRAGAGVGVEVQRMAVAVDTGSVQWGISWCRWADSLGPAAASPSRSTSIRSSRRWPPNRKLLIAPQYHLLNHQSLENGLGRESSLHAEDRRGQRASGFVLELIPEDEVPAIGQVPPVEYAGP